MLRISILAVLADRDDIVRDIISHTWISILAVLADRDGVPSPFLLEVSIFQSSRSLRTATAPAQGHTATLKYFNPRGPCGPRLSNCAGSNYEYTISILAVLADRDL